MKRPDLTNLLVISLKLNPSKRSSVSVCLQHRYFGMGHQAVEPMGDTEL